MAVPDDGHKVTGRSCATRRNCCRRPTIPSTRRAVPAVATRRFEGPTSFPAGRSASGNRRGRRHDRRTRRTECVLARQSRSRRKICSGVVVETQCRHDLPHAANGGGPAMPGRAGRSCRTVAALQGRLLLGAWPIAAKPRTRSDTGSIQKGRAASKGQAETADITSAIEARADIDGLQAVDDQASAGRVAGVGFTAKAPSPSSATLDEAHDPERQDTPSHHWGW